MYSLNMQPGKLNWSKEETNSWIIAAPLLVDGLLYYGTSDSHCFPCVKEGCNRRNKNKFSIEYEGVCRSGFVT